MSRAPAIWLLALASLPRAAGAQARVQGGEPTVPAEDPVVPAPLAPPPAQLPPAPPPLAQAPLAPAGPLTGAGLRWSGFLQVDAVVHDQLSEDELDPATRAPLNNDRVLLRRGHLRLDAQRSLFGASLELDGNTLQGPTLRLFSADVSARWEADEPGAPPPLRASLGLVRIPFGLEVRQLDVDRLFLEQGSAARALFPGSNALGGKLEVALRFLRLQLALLSGEPTGALRFAALAPTSSKDVAGRLGVEAEVAPGALLEAGVSALEGTGFHPGTPATKDVLVWRDANQDGVVQLSEIQVIPGSAAEPSSTFRRFAAGADARLTVRLGAALALQLGAELFWASNLDRALYPADPVGSGRDQREHGFSASVSLDLPWSLRAGARFDRYDPDADVTATQGGVAVPFDASVSTLAVALVWRIEPGARLVAEYDRNRNAFGRGADGRPTSLAADALTLRAEMQF